MISVDTIEGLSDSAYIHLIGLKHSAPYLDSLSKQSELQFWLNTESALIFLSLAVVCSIVLLMILHRGNKERHLLVVDCLIKEIQKIMPPRIITTTKK